MEMIHTIIRRVDYSRKDGVRGESSSLTITTTVYFFRE
jgi:hypothetical protein